MSKTRLGADGMRYPEPVFRLREVMQSRSKILGFSTLTGAYEAGPLRLIEIAMHELAHMVVMGHDRFKYRAVGSSISIAMDVMSNAVCDEMEVDASLITYLAGRKLGLWEDYTQIRDGMLTNLNHMGNYERYKNLSFIDRYIIGGKITYDEQVDALLAAMIGGSKKARKAINQLRRMHEPKQEDEE